MRLPIRHAVVFTLLPAPDADQDVRTIGRDGGERLHFAKKQDTIRPWIGDVGKSLEHFPDLRRRSEEAAPQVARKLVLDPLSDLFQPRGPEPGHHAARRKRSGELGVRRG